MAGWPRPAPAGRGRRRPGPARSARHPPEVPLSQSPSQTPDTAPAGFTELDARRLGRVRRFFAQRPVASDVLVCLVYAVAVVGEAGPQDVSGLLLAGRPAAALSLVLAVLGVAVLAVRRRWPVRVALAMAALGVLHVLVAGHVGAFDLGFALALYVVAASRPQRFAWSVLGIASVTVVGALLLWGGRPDPTPGTVTVATAEGTEVRPLPEPVVTSDAPSFLLVGLGAFAIGANVRARRLHTRALVDRHQQLVDAGEQHAKLAAAAEQARIAREMHDVVAHGLTVMIALSDGARVAVRRSPDDAVAALDLLSETGRSALADMRRMLGVLRGADVPLEPQPGTHDLESLAQQFRAAGLTVHLTTAGPALPADAGLALTVYRVVQESLTNALRHAGSGARVDVLVRHGAGRIGIEVVDDGGADPATEADPEPGRRARLSGRLAERLEDPLGTNTDAGGTEALVPDQPVRTGRGLVGMRERAAVYGGSVAAGPYRGGWRVHVELRTEDSGAATTTDEHDEERT
ncbi:histidine kinase [Cellulomonas sp. C5510]|uniref:sensor histidine kinase n=1 Tax=Cellulomonas sp. C5510 TaxID=2871170 RepID=UPI001C986D77|nr:histidine kinase [Cellulomonas sp. C5510]QZN86356.1 hypothetical protein K5O09_04050 [Cellulomonas sp. C5510]